MGVSIQRDGLATISMKFNSIEDPITLASVDFIIDAVPGERVFMGAPIVTVLRRVTPDMWGGTGLRIVSGYEVTPDIVEQIATDMLHFVRGAYDMSAYSRLAPFNAPLNRNGLSTDIYTFRKDSQIAKQLIREYNRKLS
jgi:hypothetical protein